MTPDQITASIVCILQRFKIVGRPPAYELQTNRTTYDTVFNCQVVQLVKFDFRK